MKIWAIILTQQLKSPLHCIKNEVFHSDPTFMAGSLAHRYISPIATCAERTAWFMVSAQMWRLWTAFTPFTASRPSRTSLYFTPVGVPECRRTKKKKRKCKRLAQAIRSQNRTNRDERWPYPPSGRQECPSWWWRLYPAQIKRTGRCRWGQPSCILAK